MLIFVTAFRLHLTN